MLSVSVLRGATLGCTNCDLGGTDPQPGLPTPEILDPAVWLDLRAPSHADNRIVEQALGVVLPRGDERDRDHQPAVRRGSRALPDGDAGPAVRCRAPRR